MLMLKRRRRLGSPAYREALLEAVVVYSVTERRLKSLVIGRPISRKNIIVRVLPLCAKG